VLGYRLFKNGLYCLTQGISLGSTLANATFEPSPTLFNPVEIWRVRRQIQQAATRSRQQSRNASLMMKGGIIANHDLSGLQGRD
jgi:hypothetical protein